MVCTCLRSHQYRVPGRDAQYKYPVFTGKNDHQIPTAQKTLTLLEKHPKNRNGCSGKNGKSGMDEAAAVHTGRYLQDQFQIPDTWKR